MTTDDTTYDPYRAGVAVTLAFAVVGLTACTAVTNPHHTNDPERRPDNPDDTGLIDPSGAPDTPLPPEGLRILGSDLA